MELLESLRGLIKTLRREKREQHHRHVSVGDLLTDRWEMARDYGFGSGTSCYDNVLILGDVTVGKHCWIGPNVILDGSGGGLFIGDYVDISAGVHIYTHDTVKRVISGGVAGVEYAPTRIGSCVYIGPQSVIQKGITIGDHVVIGAMSLINRDIPSNSRVWGIPATPRSKRAQRVRRVLLVLLCRSSFNNRTSVLLVRNGVPDEYGCVIGDGLHGYRTTPLEAFNAFVPNRPRSPA